MEFTHIMSTSFTKLRSYFHKVSIIINTIFVPLCDTPYAGRVKYFAAASDLPQTVFQFAVIRTMTSLQHILQAKKVAG